MPRREGRAQSRRRLQAPRAPNIFVAGERGAGLKQFTAMTGLRIFGAAMAAGSDHGGGRAEGTAEAPAIGLAAAETVFLAAAECLPDGLAIFDAEDRFVYFNPQYPQNLAASLRSEVAIGRRFSEALSAAEAAGPVYHSDLGAAYAQQRLKRRASVASGATDDHVHRLSDGRWVRVRERRMADGGLVLLTSDVTRQVEAAESIRRSEARYRAVVDTQTEFVARFTPEGRTTFVNAAYCRHMEMSAEELTSPDYDGFSLIAPEDQARHAAHLEALTPERPTAAVTFRATLSNGRERWEEWTDTGLFDERGQLVEIQAVGRDVTERRRAEEAMREGRAELERQRASIHQNEKLAALGSLLAGVAHEMNNPLSIVVGYSQMLTELAPDESTRRRASEINVAAERCARIVKSFLAMARSKPVERRPADLDAIVDSVLELAGYGLRRAGVAVARSRAEGDAKVFVDEDQIHQAVMNLVLNAQQALEGVAAPTLTIATEIRGGRVALTVADNGCGMDETVRARAFEPFFTTKPQGVGTGVGLSIFHGVVTAHDGTVELTSAPGAGTRFLIAFPAHAGAAAAAGGAAPAVGALSGRLLVVDDEPMIAALIRSAFARDAVEVVTETSGRAALERLASEPFDALLTDLRMPGMTGGELMAAAARLRPALAGRMVAMTGDALGAELSRGVERAVVLEKPLDLAAVRAALAGALDGGISGSGGRP